MVGRGVQGAGEKKGQNWAPQETLSILGQRKTRMFCYCRGKGGSQVSTPIFSALGGRRYRNVKNVRRETARPAVKRVDKGK